MPSISLVHYGPTYLAARWRADKDLDGGLVCGQLYMLLLPHRRPCVLWSRMVSRKSMT